MKIRKTKFHLRNKILPQVYKKRIFVFGYLHSIPAPTIQQMGRETKIFVKITTFVCVCVNPEILHLRHHRRDCKTKLLKLITAGTLEYYVQNTASGLLKSS